MNTVAALGEPTVLAGYALAGVQVLPAATAAEVRARWSRLPPDVAVVILTADAAQALGTELVAAGGPLTVVLPP